MTLQYTGVSEVALLGQGKKSKVETEKRNTYRNVKSIVLQQLFEMSAILCENLWRHSGMELADQFFSPSIFKNSAFIDPWRSEFLSFLEK